MPMPLSRRRFLTVSAAAAICAGASPTAISRWSGQAMGAPATLELTGVSETEARAVFRAVLHEIARLERIFSLHDPASQLSRLNRTGVLRAPAGDLVAVLDICDRLHAISDGAFDPSVQPLWRALAEGRDVERARALTGWRHLRRGARELRFDGQGRGLTLNGVAQGHVTDRVAALMRERGLSNVMIDMGEIAVLGPQRRMAGIADTEGVLVARVALSDRALATSAPFGTMIGPREGHILDPRAPGRPPPHRLVSVSASSAVMADGLSTLACLLPADRIAQCLSQVADARLEALA